MRDLSNEERFNKIFNDSKNLMMEVIEQKVGKKDSDYDKIINLVMEVQKNQFKLLDLLKSSENNIMTELEIPSFISRH